MKPLRYKLILCLALLLFSGACARGAFIAAPVEQVERPPLDFLTNTKEQLIEALHEMGPPLRGVGISRLNRRLPNAPRAYRNAVHQGIDYFVSRNTPVMAAGDGVIIRADHDFIEMSPAEYQEAILLSMAVEIPPEELSDKFLGRQVWIEHTDGVVTRYCHLERVSPLIQVGSPVIRGQVIAAVGNSGTKYSVAGGLLRLGGAPHLHFEVWHQGAFLGQGRQPAEVRALYSQIFRLNK